MLHRAADVESGQRIFIHGFTGAVGGALLSLGKIQGAQVFGTASSTKHAEFRKLGAVPFDYSNKNWITAMQELGGADAVFDPLGFESFVQMKFHQIYQWIQSGKLFLLHGHRIAARHKDC
jgi:NADPH:quinone reductase-like Zn-dependent oxidoreductase